MRRVVIAIAVVILAGIAVRVLRQTDTDQSGRFRADAWQLPNEPLLGFIEVASGAPVPVGSFPAGRSPVGALDMSGNVTEWTRSHYTKGYPYRADDGREDVKAGDLPDRVIRGGSFSNSAIGVRAAARDGADTPDGFGFIGFRVAISPSSP